MISYVDNSDFQTMCTCFVRDSLELDNKKIIPFLKSVAGDDVQRKRLMELFLELLDKHTKCCDSSAYVFKDANDVPIAKGSSFLNTISRPPLRYSVLRDSKTV